MRVFSKDILYNEGDHAEEVFFILKGKTKMYVDVYKGYADKFNVPFIMYVEGSYFGDSDVLLG
jgi:hypothetical protein